MAPSDALARRASLGACEPRVGWLEHAGDDQAHAANRKAGECDPQILSDRVVGVSGDLGWSSGAGKVIGAGGVITWSGKYLSVSRKVNGKWLYIRDTWNSDAPTPVPNPPEPPGEPPPNVPK